jgi:ADP-ribose pyrophosphatase YjhB (NUDIX family)
MSEGAANAGSQEPVVSAGGVVLVRRSEAGARIAVMESGGLASLPRAEVGPGESAETAALRAARTFVGGEPRLLRTLGETRERTDEGLILTWFWLATPGRGSASSEGPGSTPPPGYRLHWMEVEEARLSLGSEDEAELLRHLGAGDLRGVLRPLASAERRELEAALSSTRERSLSLQGPAGHFAAGEDGGLETTRGELLEEAMEFAQFEVQRAEERLGRGDLEGARRARARAARAGLFALDGPGRRVEFARLWRGLSETTRQGLGIDRFSPGPPPHLEDLLTLHDAAEAEREELQRGREVARGHQVRASLALLASAAVFSWLAAAAPLAVERGLDVPGMFALYFALLGAVGGWCGGALRRVRGSEGHAGPTVPTFDASLGAAAGVAAGAALTAGLTTLALGGHLAFVSASAYAAGWAGTVLSSRR